MLVKDIKIGKLYRPSLSAYYRESLPTYRKGVPKGLRIISLWVLKRDLSEDDVRPVMIYLGSTHEDYRLHYSNKYHWFLCHGEKMAFCNYSFRYLEKVSEKV
jgi:hypothetical protein